MRKILTLFLTAALVLQVGAFSVFADDQTAATLISNVKIDDIVATWSPDGPNQIVVKIAPGQNIKQSSVTISGSDIQLNNGKYRFALSLDAEDGFAFDNNLNIDYQGIEGIYNLSYSIPSGNSNQTMIVSGEFDNIITGSSLAKKIDMDKLMEVLLEEGPVGVIAKLKNGKLAIAEGASVDTGASKVKKISEDTYSYELVLNTDEGFTFNNRMEFLYDQVKYGYILDYKYDLNDKNHTLKIYGTAKKEQPASAETDTKTDKKNLKQGASAKSADKAITSMTGESEPKGTVFSKLRFRSTQQTENTIRLSWVKPGKAKKYVIYGAVCGSKSKMKKLVTIKRASRTSYTVRKISRKLKKGTYYKFIIVALDSKDTVVSTSKVVHAATKGGKVGNYKSVTVKKSVIEKAKKLRKGRRLKLRAKVVKQSGKLKVKTHRKLKYESTDTNVATVSSKGVVKAKNKGKCYIYAYAQNGTYKKIRIIVK